MALSRSRRSAIKQRGPLGGRDRQPLRLARALPAGLVGAPNRALVDRCEDLDVGVLQRIAGLLDQCLDRRRAELQAAQIAEQPGRLAPRDAGGGQRRRGGGDRRTERAGRHPGGQLGEGALAAIAAHPHPAVLGDLDAHDDLADLMSDGVARADAVAVGDLLAAARARLRPVLDDMVGVGDDRTVLARVTLLAALLALRLLARAFLARTGRVLRRWQRAVARAATS